MATGSRIFTSNWRNRSFIEGKDTQKDVIGSTFFIPITRLTDERNGEKQLLRVASEQTRKQLFALDPFLSLHLPPYELVLHSRTVIMTRLHETLILKDHQETSILLPIMTAGGNL